MATMLRASSRLRSGRRSPGGSARAQAASMARTSSSFREGWAAGLLGGGRSRTGLWGCGWAAVGGGARGRSTERAGRRCAPVQAAVETREALLQGARAPASSTQRGAHGHGHGPCAMRQSLARERSGEEEARARDDLNKSNGECMMRSNTHWRGGDARPRCEPLRPASCHQHRYYGSSSSVNLASRLGFPLPVPPGASPRPAGAWTSSVSSCASPSSSASLSFMPICRYSTSRAGLQ